jgi:hypothetical protein
MYTTSQPTGITYISKNNIVVKIAATYLLKVKKQRQMMDNRKLLGGSVTGAM